jgi:hypothetical protein
MVITNLQMFYIKLIKIDLKLCTFYTNVKKYRLIINT